MGKTGFVRSTLCFRRMKLLLTLYTATENRKNHCDMVIASFEDFHCPFCQIKKSKN